MDPLDGGVAQRGEARDENRRAHEADKSSGKREQQVEIYLNHIGQFIPPGNAAADDGGDGEDKRAMWREYKRKERAAKKETEKPPAQKEKTA